MYNCWSLYVAHGSEGVLGSGLLSFPGAGPELDEH
jgi:hypothetical protein